MRYIYLLFICLTFPLASLSQSTANSQVSQFEIEAPELGGTRKIWVYLPADYVTSDTSYPVLYMHDGQNLFDSSTSFSGEWNVDETLSELQLPLLVIGIENGGDKRLEELTPYVNDTYGGGRADAYLTFLIHRLKPYIDTRYRTLTNRENTGIMGSSLGGLISYYAALKHPNIFSKAGVFSPSFWFSNQIFELTKNIQIPNTDFYFLCGNQEGFDTDVNLIRMVRTFKKNPSSHPDRIAWKIIPEGQHNEKLWRESFREAILWLYSR